MPSAERRIKQAAFRMKQCYTSNNPAGFLEAAQTLREISAQSLSLGVLGDAVNALERLKTGLELVNGFIPERDGRLSNLNQCSAAFIEQVMPAFSVNGWEVINNIGLSNKIDDYLFAEKIRVDQLNGGDQSYQLLFWCLRQNRQSQYVEGLEVVVNELLTRQQEVMGRSGYQRIHHDSLDYMVQFGFFMHMNDVVKDGVQLPLLPDHLDEKLAKVFSNLHHGHPLSIKSRSLQALIASGMHRSAGQAIINVNSVDGDQINIDLLKYPSSQVVAQAFMLGCQQQTAPSLIKHLLRFDAYEVLELLKPFVDKKFTFSAFFVIKSCVEFMATEDYRPEDQNIILSILEVASLKLLRTLRDGELDYEVIREVMNKAGVPDALQFRIGTVRNNRGKILELGLGI
jgi:hypothetical protein